MSLAPRRPGHAISLIGVQVEVLHRRGDLGEEPHEVSHPFPGGTFHRGHQARVWVHQGSRSAGKAKTPFRERVCRKGSRVVLGGDTTAAGLRSSSQNSPPPQRLTTMIAYRLLGVIGPLRDDRIEDDEVFLHGRHDAIGQQRPGVLHDPDALPIALVDLGRERIAKAAVDAKKFEMTETTPELCATGQRDSDWEGLRASIENYVTY